MGERIGSDDPGDWAAALRRVDREYRRYVEVARDAGWRVRIEGKHVHLIPADRTKRIVPVPSTAGDRRHGEKNFRRDLRNAGLDV